MLFAKSGNLISVIIFDDIMFLHFLVFRSSTA